MPVKFNYSPFEEDIIIAGIKGTGKTERAKKILSEISSLPYWVHDFQRNKFTKYGKVCHTVEELEPGSQCIFQPKINDYSNFLAFCRRIHFEVGVILADIFIDQREVMWSDLAGNTDPATLSPPDRLQRVSG